MMEGYCLSGQGNYELAEKAFRGCLEVCLQEPDPPSSQNLMLRSMCLKGIATCREVVHDFVEAAIHYKQAATVWGAESEMGGHPMIAENNLHVVRSRWKDGLLDDLVAPYDEGLKVLKTFLGEGHPTISLLSMDLADALLADNLMDESETIFTEVEKQIESSCGKDHPLYARVIASLAKIYELRGSSGQNYGIVLSKMHSAVDIVVRCLGPLHSDLHPILVKYGEVCQARGMHEMAQMCHVWAVQVQAATHGPGSPLVDSAREQLVEAFLKQEEYIKAKQTLLSLLAVREQSHGEDHSILCPILFRLAEFEMHYLDDLEGAKAFLVRSLTIKKAVAREREDERHRQHMLWKPNEPFVSSGEYDLDCCPELVRLGEVNQAVEEFKEAERFLKAACRIYTAELEEAVKAQSGTSTLHHRQQEHVRDRVDKDRLQLLNVKRLLGSVLSEKGALTEAKTWYQEAHAEAAAQFGAEHPRTLAIKTSLAALLRAQEAYIPSQALYRK
mmetsp:Transcript_3061/g.4952  ORF Transcript_3061/g.4952 Transcript_3061/m.4952 type:complete len:501 (+) Transcript_3061:3-1505(+)